MRNHAQKSIIRTLLKRSYLILFLYLTFLPLRASAFERQDDIFHTTHDQKKKQNIYPHIMTKVLGNNKRKHHNRQNYRILDYNSVGVALRFNIDF